jgi:hypothetical protein
VIGLALLAAGCGGDIPADENQRPLDVQSGLTDASQVGHPTAHASSFDCSSEPSVIRPDPPRSNRVHGLFPAAAFPAGID